MVEKTLLLTRTFVWGWGMVLLYVLFNSFGNFAFKSEIQKGLSFSALVVSFPMWIGLVSITLGMVAWLTALHQLELSRAYPVAIGLNLLVIVSLSFFHFQESITLSKIGGIVLIFMGFLLLSRS